MRHYENEDGMKRDLRQLWKKLNEGKGRNDEAERPLEEYNEETTEEREAENEEGKRRGLIK